MEISKYNKILRILDLEPEHCPSLSLYILSKYSLSYHPLILEFNTKNVFFLSFFWSEIGMWRFTQITQNTGKFMTRLFIDSLS